MNSRVTLILVILLIGLGGYLYFFEGESDLRNDTVETASPAIPIYDTTYGEYDIVELEIVGLQSTAHFVRTDEALTRDWKMVEPFTLLPDQLDQVRVNGAATRLGKLTANQIITDVVELAPYGLDVPELSVTLTISNGQTVTLHTGARTPVNNSRYLRTATDDTSVYLIFDFAIEDLHRLLEEPPVAPTPLPTITPTHVP